MPNLTPAKTGKDSVEDSQTTRRFIISTKLITSCNMNFMKLTFLALTALLVISVLTENVMAGKKHHRKGRKGSSESSEERSPVRKGYKSRWGSSKHSRPCKRRRCGKGPYY
ncbi:hypothetical protein EB796_024482 [Bugula neritina]|uniref:Uncharacterized protein n=1 Tax=Bugula neritina TaxID=10212 RepID=A0A7J7IUI2_BUGNE|nr:hypothetical protein EB796_024482 [Bugula neritina]